MFRQIIIPYQLNKEVKTYAQNVLFYKGTLVGFAVGAAVGVMTDPLSDRERRKISKKTEGIFRNIGSVMDNIIDIFH